MLTSWSQDEALKQIIIIKLWCVCHDKKINLNKIQNIERDMSQISINFKVYLTLQSFTRFVKVDVCIAYDLKLKHTLSTRNNDVTHQYYRFELKEIQKKKKTNEELKKQTTNPSYVARIVQ